MKTMKLLIPVAALLLFAGQAAAQSEGAEIESREAEVARKLEEAERKMAEAARQIAELSSERLPQLRELQRRIEIINDGRPRLGVNIGEENSDGPVEGVSIVGVTPGSAADDAGLRAGDVITAINDETMSANAASEATRLILDFMKGVEEGDILQVEYLRDGKVGSVEVEPRPVEIRTYAFGGIPRDFSMPSMPQVHVAPEMVEKFRNSFTFSWPGNVWAGMELVELNEGLGKYFGADTGVLVVSAPESNAMQLEDGDVIRKIDGREPTSDIARQEETHARYRNAGRSQQHDFSGARTCTAGDGTKTGASTGTAERKNLVGQYSPISAPGAHGFATMRAHAYFRLRLCAAR
jgi:hypothetical protein